MNIAANTGDGLIEVNTPHGTELIRMDELSQAIEKGYDLNLWMKRYKLDQAEIKNTIAAMGRRWIPNGGGVTFFSGSVECKLRIDHDPVITPEDVGKLREILGSRFDDLVFSKTSYRPTKKLIILGESDDSIAQLITFKERSPSLRFKKR